MLNGALHLALAQILHTDGHLVEQVGDDLCRLATVALLLGVVQASRNHVRVHILGAARSNDLINAILNDGKLPSIEDHADLRVREVKLLISTASPWQFRDFAALHVPEEDRVVGECNKETILVNVDFRNLVLRLQHDALLSLNTAHNDL